MELLRFPYRRFTVLDAAVNTFVSGGAGAAAGSAGARRSVGGDPAPDEGASDGVSAAGISAGAQVAAPATKPAAPGGSVVAMLREAYVLLAALAERSLAVRGSLLPHLPYFLQHAGTGLQTRWVSRD